MFIKTKKGIIYNADKFVKICIVENPYRDGVSFTEYWLIGAFDKDINRHENYVILEQGDSKSFMDQQLSRIETALYDNKNFIDLDYEY